MCEKVPQENPNGELFVEADEPDMGTFGVSDVPCHDDFMKHFQKYMESDAEEYSPKDINILKRMMAIFPKVALWIKQEHRLTTWLNLFEQLAIYKIN